MNPIVIPIGEIYFEGGNLCRPRYPFFYRYPPISSPLQLEPAFQVDASKVEELKVEIRLDATPGETQVELVDDPQDPGSPLCREINDGGFEPPQIEYAGGSKTSCVLTFRPRAEAPKTRVFRLYCERQGTDLTDEEKVHGGLFLSFTCDPTGQMGREIPPTKFPELRPGSVWLLGAGAEHAPVYDHFYPLAMPDGVELEPAFRVREGQLLGFGMVQGIELASWQTGLRFLQPEEQPDDLYVTHTSTYYAFSWQSAPRDCPGGKDCFRGQIVTFHLQPVLPAIANFHLEGWTEEEYRRAVEGIGVDPTIIQPPPCDPFYQVCYRDVPAAPARRA